MNTDTSPRRVSKIRLIRRSIRWYVVTRAELYSPQGFEARLHVEARPVPPELHEDVLHHFFRDIRRRDHPLHVCTERLVQLLEDAGVGGFVTFTNPAGSIGTQCH